MRASEVQAVTEYLTAIAHNPRLLWENPIAVICIAVVVVALIYKVLR